MKIRCASKTLRADLYPILLVSGTVGLLLSHAVNTTILPIFDNRSPNSIIGGYCLSNPQSNRLETGLRLKKHRQTMDMLKRNFARVCFFLKDRSNSPVAWRTTTMMIGVRMFFSRSISIVAEKRH